MNVEISLYLIYTSLFMLKHTSWAIRTKIWSMKLYTFFWLVFMMYWLKYMLHLNDPMSKLALISISTESAIGLNPIFAHLRFILGLIALFPIWQIVLICCRIYILLADLPLSPSVSLSFSLLITIIIITLKVFHFFTLEITIILLYLVIESLRYLLIGCISILHNFVEHLDLRGCEVQS